jgi:hypothetical protein
MDNRGKTGVSALVDLAVTLENKHGMELMMLGRPPEAAPMIAAVGNVDTLRQAASDLERHFPSDGQRDASECVLEIAGRWLLYRVALKNSEQVELSVAILDRAESPESLLHVRDDASGWQMILNLVEGLERYEVRSLRRPITVGVPGSAACWVIA